jgi:hypothetical protein
MLFSMSLILRTIERIPPMRAKHPDAAPSQRLAPFASAPYRLCGITPQCLRRSLVLCALLRRRGVAAQVCFGVDRSGSTFAAHAWVAVAGISLETTPSRFHELPRAWSA